MKFFCSGKFMGAFERKDFVNFRKQKLWHENNQRRRKRDMGLKTQRFAVFGGSSKTILGSQIYANLSTSRNETAKKNLGGKQDFYRQAHRDCSA